MKGRKSGVVHELCPVYDESNTVVFRCQKGTVFRALYIERELASRYFHSLDDIEMINADIDCMACIVMRRR